MAQAGLHALVGTLTRKLPKKPEWLLLGVILGSLLPDLDNYAVAVATVAKLDTHGLHRTFTHSIITALVIVTVFALIGVISKQPRWTGLGIGLGSGIVLHIVLDLLIWFNGVQLLWPFNLWINIWGGIQPPEWFMKFLDPAEFLFFALFFIWLANVARKYHTDTNFLGALRWWIVGMFILFLVFTPLAYLMNKGYLTIFGAFYLLSATAAFIISIRVRQTLSVLT
jgi:membrane-bound metal-dependent hydrolase YbcI (DUF457 family)